MMEMAQELRTTHAIVLYWLKKHGIPRRSWSERTYCKLNPDGDPFAIPSRLSARQRELLNAGILLYWAEGKKNGGTIQIANLDARMLQLFVTFLREVCCVNERRLFLYVRVHRQYSLRAARRYWIRALGLRPANVLVYPHTDTRSDASKQWSRHGIATLNFNNTKLKMWLKQAIETYVERQLSDGSSIIRDETLNRGSGYEIPSRIAEFMTAEYPQQPYIVN